MTDARGSRRDERRARDASGLTPRTSHTPNHVPPAFPFTRHIHLTLWRPDPMAKTTRTRRPTKEIAEPEVQETAQSAVETAVATAAPAPAAAAPAPAVVEPQPAREEPRTEVRSERPEARDTRDSRDSRDVREAPREPQRDYRQDRG